MMNRKNLFLSGFYLLLVLPVLWISQGCGDKHERENIMLDSLDMMLKQTAEFVEIDIPTIQARKNQMESYYGLIKTYYTDTVSLEMGNNMQKYRGVMKVYSLFLDEIFHCQEEMKALNKQVSTLRNDVNKGKFTKPEFRKYYDTEKADILINLQLAEKIGKTTLEVEPEYQRLSKYIQGVVSELRKSNPEVDQILKSE